MKSVDLLTNAQAELENLLPLRNRLTESLTVHANRLQAEGALPSEELLVDLQDYRRRLIELSKRLPDGISHGRHLANQREGELVPESLTWDSMKRALQEYQTQLHAVQILVQILELRHREDPGFPPLVECQKGVTRLKEKIHSGSIDAETFAELESLNAGTHPCCALFKLVVDLEHLPDEVWTELNDQVISAFGRPLATAVARGKIEYAAQDTAAVPIRESADEPAVIVENDSERDDADSVDGRLENPECEVPQLATHTFDEAADSQPIADAISQFELSNAEVEQASDSSIFGSPRPSAPAPRQLAAPELTGDELSRQDVSGTFLIKSPVRQAPRDSILSEPSAESIFDSIGPSSAKSAGRSYRSAEIKLVSDQPYQWGQADRPRGASSLPGKRVAHCLPSLARHASQVEGDIRHAQLSQIILQLLCDDRLTLAYHLTRGIETRLPGFPTNLPSWLIHSLVLSRHVCYSKGEIARKIEDDLKEFSPQLLTAGDTDWNEATGFFVRAAALIPALLTSSPSASAILRTFRITPGLSHLYNYCSRLSTYGHRLQGQASDLFTPDCDMSNWETEIAALQQSIETWLTDSIKKACPTTRSSLLFLHAHWTLTSGSVSRYSESARLWSRWQECFRLVHRLLKPVRNALEQERNWVKGEIDRLTQSIRLEPTGSETNQPLPPGTTTFPQEAMLKMIREAVDFASRWLRLCASKPAQGRTLASRDAEALRDEILERTDAVLAELGAFSQHHNAPRTQAAIACLCSTVEHLRAIFSPHSTLALRETDPRHVIYGELLKVPNLKMNDQWVPTVDPLTLENEILTYLSGEARDWKHAFEMQCSQRDHVATERILQLNVWRTEQEREALRRRRESEIQVSRDEIERDLVDVRHAIAEEVQNKRAAPAFQSALEVRLQRVQVSLDSTLDFAAAQNEINQVRLSLERQKRDHMNAEKRADPSAHAVKPTVTFHNIDATDLPQDTWAQNIFSEN